MTSPIECLVSKGFRITSDPSTYASGIWGYRRYVQNGIHHDAYCGGYHRAYDVSDREGADLPAVVDGTIVDGTRQNGNFGGTVVLSDLKGDYQYIYGHVKNIQVKVGDIVKQGDKLAEQSNTNYYNNPMDSHLHFQVQKQAYIPNEKDFVCTGIDPDNINVNDYTNDYKRKEDDIMANYKIVNMFVSPSKYRIKAPYAMSPTTLTVHNTANTAPARNEVAYMRRNNNMTSYHVAIDDKEAVQAIPFNRNAWAAGDGGNGQGNRRSIHVEICYSMDNGYRGRYSPRHAQAEKNAALYIAYVLDQYGWGVSRLRQHYDWSRKDCPHKMRAWNNWRAFKNMVQGYLNDIKKGNSPGTSKPTPSAPSTSKPSTPKASGSTYTVRKGDTLWSIANANGVTVANLKSWNNLKSNIINIGQKLNVKKPSSKKSSNSKGLGKGGAGNIKYKWDNWKTNRHGTHYVAVDATFIVGSEPIYVYDDSPFVNLANRAPSRAQPGARIKVKELARQDGHVWAGYYTGSGQWRYIPIKKWNGGGGRVTNKGLWGKFV